MVSVWVRASTRLAASRPSAIAARHSQRALSTIVGIRCEDKNKWERRVPLAPKHVKQLVEDGVPVQVETSTRRVFKDYEYEEVGAKIVDSMRDANIILGVKEIPIPKLEDNKTYMIFSHTHKGQKHNMPSLQTVLDRRIRLMDYELLTDDKGRRLVRFGTFAGYAGMVDFLHGLGLRMLALGYDSPFLNISMTYSYRDLSVAKEAVQRAGRDIANGALTTALGPFIFAFTGDGHVSHGAHEIFEQLPHKWISADEVAQLAQSNTFDRNVIYGVKIREQDYLVNKETGAPMTDKAHYRANPHLYESIFHTKLAPFVTGIITGHYWDEQFPRLLSNEQTPILAKSRLLGVADISCDVEGSLQFMSKVTKLEEPFFMYDPAVGKIHNNMDGTGFFVMSVDNLPAELPREASNHFSDALIPHVRELAKGGDSSTFSVTLRNAIIAEKGELFGVHKRLAPTVAEFGGRVTATGGPDRSILVLGSGMVAGPLVDYLCGVPGINVTIASNNVDEARRLQKGRTTVSAELLDAANASALAAAVARHDVVVSFMPAPLHPSVASACLAHGKHLVTASYISPAMRELHFEAAQRNLTFLNELGLDPGIDHMSAMSIIDDARARGGRVTSFRSVCGGLPAPEVSDNFLGYKLSWSPRGFLTAGLNAAKWLEEGEIREIPAGQLFANPQPIAIYPGYALECLPNRDSVSYKEAYGLKHAKTIFRGTLRYAGFSDMMVALGKLGLFDLEQRDMLKPGAEPITWRALMDQLHPKRDSLIEGFKGDVHKIRRLLDGLQFLGILDETPVAQRGTMLDAFCAILEKKLGYNEGERDMVMMHHDFVVEYDNDKQEHITSTLIEYGEPNGYTAMARTVGIPAAIGARMVLEGKIKTRGVLGPMGKEVYEPVLKELALNGISMKERVETH